MSAGTHLEHETLRHHAEILQVTFETLPMGVMVADLEGKLLFNAAARRILAREPVVPLHRNELPSSAGTYPIKSRWSRQTAFPCSAPATENSSVTNCFSPESRTSRRDCDVEGHGFGSALVMALPRAYLRSFATMDLEPDRILAQVNRMLAADLEHGRFVTLAWARLDVSRRSLIYAGAGHTPGFVLNRAGLVVHVLESKGPPLGLFPDSKFSCQKEILLEPGQIVVLLTDGITESVAPGGAEFGTRGALNTLPPTMPSRHVKSPTVSLWRPEDLLLMNRSTMTSLRSCLNRPPA